MPLRAVAVAALTATALFAQSPGAADPFSMVPADCQVVIHMQGPGAFAEPFAGTRLGKALAGPVLAPIQEWFDRKLQEVERADPAAWRGVRPLLTTLMAHRGPMVLGLRLEVEDLVTDLAASTPPDFLATLVLGGDAASDLPQLANSIGELLRGADLGPVRELTVAGEPLVILQLPFGQLALPVVRDGNLVVLFGTRLEQNAERFLAVPGDQRFVLQPELRQAAMSIVVDVGGTLDSVQAQLVAAEDEIEPWIQKALLPLELPALRRLSWRLFAEGPHVDQEAIAEFAGPLRGMWKVFLPPRRAPAAVLEFLPAAASTFSTSRFDPRAFHELYVRLFDDLGDQFPVSREEFEATLLTKVKLRLKEDVLDRLTGEMLRVDDLTAVVEATDEDDEAPAAAERFDAKYGDGCFVLPLHDGAAFATSLEKSVRALGLHAARKTDEYAGIKVHRLVVLGSYVVEYAVTDRAFVFGVGGREGTVRNLRSILDAAAARAGGTAEIALPAGVQALLEGLPDGWSDIDVTSLGEALEGTLGYLTQLEELVDDPFFADDAEIQGLLADYRPFGEAMKRLRPALLLHGAETTVTVTYKADNRVVLRSRW